LKPYPSNRWFSLTLGVTALLAGTVFGARLGGWWGALAGGALGAGLGYFLYRPSRRKAARRLLIASQPFPVTWRQFLESHFRLYRRFPPALRKSFEDDLRVFLVEQRITGIGIEVSEDLKLLVGASAVTLSVGWPEYEWSALAEVLLYPNDFDRDYAFGRSEFSGQAHPWGTIILSVPSLLRSFEIPDDGYHVGFHEFAHLLDKEGVRFDGIPADLDSKRAQEWVALQAEEMKRLEEGRSVLDPYGADNPAEFLAVAVEAFFEKSREMRTHHPKLYQMLSSYFAQDPASWGD